MSGRRIGLAVALAAYVIGGLTGGVATGGEKTRTKVRMKMECKFGTCEKVRRASTPATFSGNVRSKNPDCVKDREVKVVRKGGAPNPGPIGTTTVNSSGKWTLNEPDALEGTYRAKTNKAPGCKTGRSKRWTLNFARSARANQNGVKTTVTINDECAFDCRNYTARFFGKVRADKPTCERRRKVILLRKGKPGEGFQKIGDTKSDGSGNWEMIRNDKPGFTDYMVKVKEVRKAMLRCLGATSDKESHDSFRRAHNEEFEVTLTIKDKGAKFKGRVRSDSDDCTKKRRVILYGQEAGEDPMEVGRVRSDREGRWTFQFVGDHYYAEVEEKVIERGDHKHTCLFDRSPTTPFPG